jgi:hypothetical protein
MSLINQPTSWLSTARRRDRRREFKFRSKQNRPVFGEHRSRPCEAEFGESAVPQLHVEPLERSCTADLAVPIKGESLPKGSRLLKVYPTSPQGAQRIVHLLAVAEETLFLLFYRDKKDSLGANITIKNPTWMRQPLTKIEWQLVDHQATTGVSRFPIRSPFGGAGGATPSRQSCAFAQDL